MNSLPPLESDCPDCSGVGTRNSWNDLLAKRCQKCDGSGKLLTEDGRCVLALIERHLPLLLRAVLRGMVR